MELPPGFRFHPTDEELITYYLSQKVTDASFNATVIGELDLNKFEPWDLPLRAKREEEWYFFSVKDRKYPTGLRTNRATEAGYWKATGKDKEIHRRKFLIGMKKTLVFHKGRAPRGEKTNWIMHEYRLEGDHPISKKTEWVLCRVFYRDSGAKDMELIKMNSWFDDGHSLVSDKNHVTCFSDSLEDHRCFEKILASSFGESLLNSAKMPPPISFHTNQAISAMVNLQHQGTNLLLQLEDTGNSMTNSFKLGGDVFSIAEEKDLPINMKHILLDVTNDLVNYQDGLSDSCVPLFHGWSWK